MIKAIDKAVADEFNGFQMKSLTVADVRSLQYRSAVIGYQALAKHICEFEQPAPGSA